MRAPRSFKAIVKVSLFALALLALYHLAPVLFSPASSRRPANGGAYPTPDPLLRRKPLPAQAQPTQRPGFDYEAEKRRWGEAQAKGMRDAAGRAGTGDGDGAGDGRKWAQQGGRVPPRRGAPLRPDADADADAGTKPQPARVVGLRPPGAARNAAVEARRKLAAERARAREREREDDAAAAIAAVRAAKAGGAGGDRRGALLAGGRRAGARAGGGKAQGNDEQDDGATFEAELAIAAARKARAREKLREWDERVAGAEAEGQAQVQEQARARGAAGRLPPENARAPLDRAQRVAAAVREQQQQRFGDDEGDSLVDEDGELDAAPRGAGAGSRRKKGPLGVVAAKAAGAIAGDSDDALVAKQQAAAAAAAGAKEREGGGWGQRFKKPAPPAAQPAADADALPYDPDSDLEERDTEPLNQAPAEPAPAPPKFEHHLVARFAKNDYSHEGRADRDALVIDPNSEDSFMLDGSHSKEGAGGVDKKHNVTVCALVPNENRFIGEWLLYHRLLGVERFALYDTSTPGAFGAAEVDALADRMQREGGGELGPTVEELKASVGTADAGPDGLDDKGEIRKERIAGMERWIEQGVVKMHWLKFTDKKKARDFHAHMLDHCMTTYGPSSNWLAHLDVDEFLSVSTGLYSADEPYRAGEAADGPWQYPLHDVLARPALAEAACVPLPELSFRNYGVRELERGQGVLETQTHRDVLKQSKKIVREEGLQQKTLIHTAYASTPVAYFAGPHSCEVSGALKPPEGVTTEIRNSQGSLLQDGGLYEVAKLPIEPLAIAHYLQRDLRDCLSKLSSLADPNDLHAKSRGERSCEEHYLPTASERRTLDASDKQNRFLLETPSPGTVIEDQRMSESWAARTVRDLEKHWRRAAAETAAMGKKAGGGPRLRGKGRMADPLQAVQGAQGVVAALAVPRDVVERARRKVEVVAV